MPDAPGGSTAYQRRIARGEAAGKSRQAARGHRPTEHASRSARLRQALGLSEPQVRRLGGIGRLGDVPPAMLPEPARLRREDAIHVAQAARREARRPDGLTVEETLRRERVDPYAARVLAPRAFGLEGGRLTVARSDPYRRSVWIVEKGGRLVRIEVGSRDASWAGTWWGELGAHLADKPNRFRQLHRRFVGGVEVEYDLRVLGGMAERGELAMGPYRLDVTDESMAA